MMRLQFFSFSLFLCTKVYLLMMETILTIPESVLSFDCTFRTSLICVHVMGDAAANICIFFHVKLHLDDFFFALYTFDDRKFINQVVRWSCHCNFIWHAMLEISHERKWCVNNCNGQKKRKEMNEVGKMDKQFVWFFFISYRTQSNVGIEFCFHSTLQINDSIYYESFPYFPNEQKPNQSLRASYTGYIAFTFFFMNETKLFITINGKNKVKYAMNIHVKWTFYSVRCSMQLSFYFSFGAHRQHRKQKILIACVKCYVIISVIYQLHL